MRSVLITGCDTGLGVEFARQYAAEDYRVFATCLDPSTADAARAIRWVSDLPCHSGRWGMRQTQRRGDQNGNGDPCLMACGASWISIAVAQTVLEPDDGSRETRLHGLF